LVVARREGYGAGESAGVIVSVILPTYDRLEYLPAAVDSVLNQTYRDFELVIADDGSGPETRRYLESLGDPRVRVLWLPHSGRPSVARNAAIRIACGHYLAFMDSDDIWLPAKLEKQLYGMQGRRWSYTAISIIDTHGRPLSDKNFKPRVPYDGDILEHLLTIEAIVTTPSVMAERSLVDEAGNFDEEQVVNEDYDLWIRLAMRSEVAAITERLVMVRHKESDPQYQGNTIGGYQGWVRLYGKLAGALADPRLRTIARRERARNALQLARTYVADGDDAAARRALRDALSYSWTYPAWIWAAAKTAAPASWRSLYRRLRRRNDPHHPDRDQRLPSAQ
jgi:glycosyltransferase involved in cell wall biosynthesis